MLDCSVLKTERVGSGGTSLHGSAGFDGTGQRIEVD
jgi:hypothetical protein